MRVGLAVETVAQVDIRALVEMNENVEYREVPRPEDVRPTGFHGSGIEGELADALDRDSVRRGPHLMHIA